MSSNVASYPASNRETKIAVNRIIVSLTRGILGCTTPNCDSWKLTVSPLAYNASDHSFWPKFPYGIIAYIIVYFKIISRQPT